MTVLLQDLEQQEAASTAEEPESYTVAQARALGFDDEGIAALREVGLLRETERGEPWQPRTLDDVSWVILQHKRLQAEEEAIKAQFARRMLQVERRRQWLAIYEEACREITRAALEIDPKTGKPRRKYVDLEDGRAKLRTVPGGPKVVDEERLLSFIVTSDPAGEGALAAAVRATITHTGAVAIAMIRRRDESVKPSILATPVKEYVKALPAVPDPETGELKPSTIAGVEIVPPSETWGWE